MKKSFLLSAVPSARSGFTMVEMLVVVLIIGILTAVALPHYEKATDLSRLSKLRPVAKTVKNAEEAYFLANGKYTKDLMNLDVALPELTSDGGNAYHYGEDQTMKVNVDSTHENLTMADENVTGVRYVVYFDHSANFPGEIHCEASSGSDDAKALCASMGVLHGTQGAFTTYLVSGAGVGTLSNTSSQLVTSNGTCVENSAAGCTRRVYDDGTSVETTGSGYYGTTTCTYNANGQKTNCTRAGITTQYDPLTGNKVKETLGSAVKTYDPETGNILSYVNPGDFAYKYEYDPETGKRTARYYYGGDDGRTLYTTTYYEYDPVSGIETAANIYNKNGKLESRREYDPATGEETWYARFSNGQLVGLNYFEHEGDTTSTYRINPSTGNISSYSSTDEDGSTFNIEYSRKGLPDYVSGYDEDGRYYSYDYERRTLYSAYGYDENDRQFYVSFDYSTGNATYAYGYDDDGTYYQAHYNSNGNFTSYQEGNDYYKGDGTVTQKSFNNGNEWGTYYYNNDGTFSEYVRNSTYYNPETGQNQNFSGELYYDSNGNLTKVRDNSDTTYVYNSDGSLAQIGGYYSSDPTYKFNSAGNVTYAAPNGTWSSSSPIYEYYDNGQLKSVKTHYDNNVIYYNQDGSVNYNNSYVRTENSYRDRSSEAINNYIATNSSSWVTQASGWGTAATSGARTYNSWGEITTSTVTQDSWGKADTSAWVQSSSFSKDDHPAQEDWLYRSDLSVPTYTTPTETTRTYTDAEQNPSL